MADGGHFYLRWQAERLSPEEERFGSLDAALDAVEARWDALQHRAPQVLDARRVLLLSTADLQRMWTDESGTDQEAAG